MTHRAETQTQGRVARHLRRLSLAFAASLAAGACGESGTAGRPDGATPIPDGAIIATDGATDGPPDAAGPDGPDAGTGPDDAAAGPTDPAYYNFETGAQGWAPGGSASAADATAGQAFAGRQALEIQLAGTGQGSASVLAPPVPQGVAVTFHVWLPVGHTLTGVQAFVQEDQSKGWRWTADWRAAAQLASGWNTFEVTVPADASPLQDLGVQFDIGGTWSGTVHVDSVSWPGAGPAPDGGSPGDASGPADAGLPDRTPQSDAAPGSDAGLPPGALVIMPLGDSITGEPHTYRETLYGQLTGAGCAVHFVGSQVDQYATIPEKNHEGHPGWTIGNIADSVDAWLADYQPAYILLMIGTNDVAWWCADNGATVADHHAALVDQILADVPNAWVVVASIPPESSSIIAPNNVDRAQLVADFNVAMKQRLDARIAQGQPVRFADVNAALTVSDLRDGVHPTVAGYDKVAGVWFQALQPIAACLGP